MKFDNQLRYGVSILAAYRGDMPLHTWLKNYFREHKQMGSRDRRLIGNMVYGFYRPGRALPDLPVEERILAGLFLCQEEASDFLQYFKPVWNEHASSSQQEKIALFRQTYPDFDPEAIFPWKGELSEGVDLPAFNLSFLQQPDLFLRIRPGHQDAVMDKLKDQGIDYAFLPPFTVRLPNGSKAEEWFVIDKEVVIQDYSSQRTASFLQAVRGEKAFPHKPTVWDACAASGGKSLLMHDSNPPVDLTVSDIRESILRNLQERFRKAGIRDYRSFVADLGGKTGVAEGGDLSQRGGVGYDLVIADVPCSGSGTWARTPEELYFFDEKKIREYRDRQRKILSNLVSAVKPGGHFVYITCSVFREENEEQVNFILGNSDLKLEKMELLKGYGLRADTLFAARFAG
ncbi:MAG: Fmu (Sun) domain-containing protein [Puia sp.]|nr:Fmu (Sun) domain-containing protein [Puia sp.]